MALGRIMTAMGLAAALIGAASAAEPGNPVAGKRAFAKCRACHDLGAPATAKPGPHLGNLFGRAAGANPAYDRYSAALKSAGFTWDPARLDAWLANPRTFLPGNKMAFAGLPDANERRDLIAYLKQATGPQKQTLETR